MPAQLGLYEVRFCYPSEIPDGAELLPQKEARAFREAHQRELIRAKLTIDWHTRCGPTDGRTVAISVRRV